MLHSMRMQDNMRRATAQYSYVSLERTNTLRQLLYLQHIRTSTNFPGLPNPSTIALSYPSRNAGISDGQMALYVGKSAACWYVLRG